MLFVLRGLVCGKAEKAVEALDPQLHSSDPTEIRSIQENTQTPGREKAYGSMEMSMPVAQKKKKIPPEKDKTWI